MLRVYSVTPSACSELSPSIPLARQCSTLPPSQRIPLITYMSTRHERVELLQSVVALLSVRPTDVAQIRINNKTPLALL